MATAFSTEEALQNILDSSTDSEPDFTGPEELESSSDKRRYYNIYIIYNIINTECKIKQ